MSRASSPAALIRTDADIKRGLTALVAADPRLAPVMAVAGSVPLRLRPGGIEGLMRAVVSQQLSTASAEAIWLRLRAAYEPFHHTVLLRARAPKLQRLGLSGAKIRTLRAVAQAVHEGHIDFDALAAMPADEAHAALTAIHGIGPWTSDIYLLSCVGHPDAWPAGDLALQEAAKLAFGMKARPTGREMGPLAEPWRPWRAVAARLLWSYYRVVKKRDPVPI
ncbi:MAG: DNA-3-methyladenine glycosylase [Variibacter sp.]